MTTKRELINKTDPEIEEMMRWLHDTARDKGLSFVAAIARRDDSGYHVRCRVSSDLGFDTINGVVACFVELEHQRRAHREWLDRHTVTLPNLPSGRPS